MNPAVKWIGGAFLGLFGVALAALMVLGLLSETGQIPSPDVVVGADVPQEHLDLLRQANILDPDETIELFYSEGVLSIKGGGSLITNQGVVAYESFDDVDDVNIYKIFYEDITSVEQTQKGDISQFSIIRVTAAEEDSWLELWLPHEDKEDQLFMDRVKAKMTQQPDA